MQHTLLPIHIKPHLVPFFFRKFQFAEYIHEGRKINAAKITNHSSLGRFIRLLLEKSERKVKCDKSSQIFLLVTNYAKPLGLMKSAYKYEDGRTGFLYLPEAGEKLINETLQEEFETASMYYIHSRHKSNSTESLDDIILDFFNKYNLEELDFDILRVRRDYYRKVKQGYFRAKVFYDPLTQSVRAAQ